jgi:hypothetical protein
VGGGVVFGHGPMEGHGFLDGRQRTLVAVGIRKRGAEVSEDRRAWWSR